MKDEESHIEIAQVGRKLKEIESHLQELNSSRFPIPDSRFPVETNDEIDLRELWAILWSGKWIIVVSTLIFAILSVFFTLSLPNIYKSEALLAPAEDSSGNDLSRMAGSLGGLASLAGVNIGNGDSDKTIIAIEILKSREFISKFVEKHNLLVPLMAAKDWIRSENKLVIDEDVYDESTEKWVRDAKPPRGAEPSSLEAYEHFVQLLSVSEDAKTSLISLSIEHYSPNIAKEWVSLLIIDINEEVRRRDVAQANKSIQYLSKQLDKMSIAGMKAVFYELIEEQTKTVMFAEVRDEYVFKTIDKAVVPEIKSSPRKGLICILGTFFGGFIGLVIVLVRFIFGRKN